MRIKLSNKFYDKEAIESTISSFKEVCDSRIVDDSFVIEITPKEESQNIEHEFCNFALGIAKESRDF